jgi:sec-independent protein translocase protein TatB
MPSFSDSIFLFVLALLLFGPKRLPVLARELGKWVGEFRRASNEFKMQMEEELRASEQEDRQKKIAAMEAAAPVRPELPAAVVEAARADMAAADADGGTTIGVALPETTVSESATVESMESVASPAASPVEPTVDAGASVGSSAGYAMVDGVRTPLPIATSGEMKIMPPATGLPTPKTGPRKSALQELLDAVPKAAPDNSPESAAGSTAEATAPAVGAAEAEVTAHGN